MKLVLETPKLVEEARGENRGWNWFIELLAFVGVFIVSALAMTVVLIPGELVLLGQDEAYRAALAAGDVNAAMEAAVQIGTSDGYMVISLFADAMMILIVLLFCKLIQKRRMRTLGFTKDGIVKEYLIGAGIGFLIFSAAVLLCVVTGALHLNGVSDTFSLGMFVLFTLGFMVQGMAEEVLCRGYFMVSFGRRYPIVAAVIANAVIFAALHLANPGVAPLAIVNLILFGIFASCYFIRRGNIWGIGALHSVWNLVQGNFYGIKVSGMETSCTVFSSTAVRGRDIINGGAFGLEGGLAVSVVLIVGILLLCFVKGKKTADMEG